MTVVESALFDCKRKFVQSIASRSANVKSVALNSKPHVVMRDSVRLNVECLIIEVSHDIRVERVFFFNFALL
jgi:hypothetical protein